jgi:hypothetical protein
MKSLEHVRYLAREILKLSYTDKNFLYDLVEDLEEKKTHKIIQSIKALSGYNWNPLRR